MKILSNNKLKLILSILMIISFISCESFLDKQEDEALRFDQIWQTRKNTEAYWLNTMSFIDKENVNGDHDPWIGASDEATIAYDRAFRKINFGSWNPSDVPYYKMDYYYKGIRECNIFMQNVDLCSDPIVTKGEIAMWKVQTRFARAYYYFLMMRIYGPVFLLGDELVDFTATTQELYRPRNTWEQCVNYVVSELEACINDDAMTNVWRNDNEKGLGTKNACQAIISRLKLYSARDLFNGNTLYNNVKNPITPDFPELSGATLFPQTYDANKWVEAATAAYKIIEEGSHTLYRAGNNNPYEDYYGVTQQVWNSELIWTTGYGTRYNIVVSTVPTSVSGTAYGGVGPTQQQVDAYAMNNGKYPVLDYRKDGTPIIDEESEYSKNEFEMTSWSYPSWAGFESYSVTTPNMYKDREPRFYVSVFYGGGYWHHGDNKTLTSFAYGANGNKSHDHPKAGYLINKYYDHTSNSSVGKWGNITYPTFRLGEIYLNFIEAVLESKKRGTSVPSEYESKAMEVWADLRNRAGLDPITEIYPDADIDKLIELCRQERRIELAFEQHRYFDTRTWKIAEKTDSGPMYGMNISIKGSGSSTPAEYWKRTIFETRVFKSNHYLYPFSQRELDRNKLLTQNYGW